MFNVVGILFNCDKRFSKYDKVHVSQWVNSCDQSERSDKLYDGDFDLRTLGLFTVRQQMSVAFSNKISAFLNTHLNNMY